jgi:hypothetical protein
MAVLTTGISDLANGIGYIYVTDQTPTIKGVVSNTVLGAQAMRFMGARNAPLASLRAAVATLTVVSCASAGAVTDITINGVNQIGANVNCATANTTTYAALLVAAINAYTPSGYNYTASNVANVITIYAPASAGSSVNGDGVTVSVTDVTIVTTTTNFFNGSDIGGSFDESIGVKFYLNADYNGTASPTSLTNAADITKYLTVRGMEGGVDLQEFTLASDSVAGIVRRSALTMLYLDTQGAAATDNLYFINPDGFIEGDQLIIRGVAAARVTTVKSSTGAGQNIVLNDDSDFALDSQTAVIILYFSNDPVDGAFFYEITRGNDQRSIPNVTNLRTNNVATPIQGVNTTVLTSAGGTLTFVAGTDKGVQKLTGSDTLLASYNVVFDDTPAPLDGDEFITYYRASMNLNGNNISIGGYTLTQAEAQANLMFYSKYDATNAVWVTQKIADPSLFTAPLGSVSNQLLVKFTLAGGNPIDMSRMSVDYVNKSTPGDLFVGTITDNTSGAVGYVVSDDDNNDGTGTVVIGGIVGTISAAADELDDGTTTADTSAVNPADQQIILQGGNTFVITDALFTNATTNITTAANGEVNTDPLRGTGNSFVTNYTLVDTDLDNEQFQALTTAVRYINNYSAQKANVSGVGMVDENITCGRIVYFSLGTGQGTADTCDLYLFGFIVN